MAAIFRLREPLNLKPHSKAESPDIVMMTTVQDKTLLLGLAVKNYSTVQTIEDECKKMNRLCSFSDGNRLNILVVCATAYVKEVHQKFKGRKSTVYTSDEYLNIHEVVLLDLTTPDNRAEFFGIDGDGRLRERLEDIIQKIQVQSTSIVE